MMKIADRHVFTQMRHLHKMAHCSHIIVKSHGECELTQRCMLDKVNQRNFVSNVKSSLFTSSPMPHLASEPVPPLLCYCAHYL